MGIRSSNISITKHIQKYIGTAYDTVKLVADNLVALIRTTFTTVQIIVVDTSHHVGIDTVIVLPEEYVPNTGGLLVFSDGLGIHSIEDGPNGIYFEVDSTTVTFPNFLIPLGVTLRFVSGKFVDTASDELGSIDLHNDVSTAGKAEGRQLSFDASGSLVVVDSVQIIDSFTSSDVELGLSANKGRELNLRALTLEGEMPDKVEIASIQDNLVSSSTVFPLSANMGTLLKSLIDGVSQSSEVWEVIYVTSVGNFTLDLTYATTHVFMDTPAGTSTLTVSAQSSEAWEDSASFRVTKIGDGDVVITGDVGVTIKSASGVGDVTLDNPGEAIISTRIASDSWYLENTLDPATTLSLINARELYLGVPINEGMILASTIAGVRSWVQKNVASGGATPGFLFEGSVTGLAADTPGSFSSINLQLEGTTVWEARTEQPVNELDHYINGRSLTVPEGSETNVAIRFGSGPTNRDTGYFGRTDSLSTVIKGELQFYVDEVGAYSEAITGSGLNRVATATDLNLKENSLGLPATTGQILTSTTAGVRSWIDAPEGSGGGSGSNGYTRVVNWTGGPQYILGANDVGAMVIVNSPIGDTPSVILPDTNSFTTGDVFSFICGATSKGNFIGLTSVSSSWDITFAGAFAKLGLISTGDIVTITVSGTFKATVSRSSGNTLGLVSSSGLGVATSTTKSTAGFFASGVRFGDDPTNTLSVITYNSTSPGAGVAVAKISPNDHSDETVSQASSVSMQFLTKDAGEPARTISIVDETGTTVMTADRDGLKAQGASGLSKVLVQGDSLSSDPLLQAYSKVTEVAAGQTVVVGPEGVVRTNELFVIEGPGAVLDFGPVGPIANGSKWTFLLTYNHVFGDTRLKLKDAVHDINGLTPGEFHIVQKLEISGDTVELIFVDGTGYLQTREKVLSSILDTGSALFLGYLLPNRVVLTQPQGQGDIHKAYTYVNNLLTIAADENGIRVPSIATGSLSKILTLEDLPANTGLVSFNGRTGDGNGNIAPASGDYNSNTVLDSTGITEGNLSGVITLLNQTKLTDLTEGANVTIDRTDPTNPTISFSGVGGGTSNDITNLSVIPGTDVTDGLNYIAPLLPPVAVSGYTRLGQYFINDNPLLTDVDYTPGQNQSWTFVQSTVTGAPPNSSVFPELDALGSTPFVAKIFIQLQVDTSLDPDIVYTLKYITDSLSGGLIILDYTLADSGFSFVAEVYVEQMTGGLGFKFRVSNVKQDGVGGFFPFLQSKVGIQGYYR